MANGIELISNRNGWAPWTKLNNKPVGGPYLYDAPIPSDYLPASTFRVASIAANCRIPWIVPFTSWQAFYAAGGTTSLVGSLAGLSLVNILAQFPSIFTMGLYKSYPAMNLSYCISNIFNQEISIAALGQNLEAIPEFELTSFATEMIENSQFKKIFVFQGEIVTSIVDSGIGEIELDIGIDKSGPFVGAIPSYIDVYTENIEIDPAGNEIRTVTSKTCSVIRVTDDWRLVISICRWRRVSSFRDFYELSRVHYIRNPYLMGGRFAGFRLGDKNLPTTTANQCF